MVSPFCERAVRDALKHGKALLKFISPNDVDLTGAHQAGFYLPKGVGEQLTGIPPQKGANAGRPVTVLWPDGRRTASVVKWYGRSTRSEYRLTRFGRGFPWRTADNMGSLLVLIPEGANDFIAYVLDSDEDIEELQASLGVEVLGTWAYYQRGQVAPRTEDDCLNGRFRAFAEAVEQFPQVRVFSDTTRSAVLDCVAGFRGWTPDDQLVRLIQEEYGLYRMVERKIFQPEVQRLFASIDDFLDTASRILQARKSRAGRSLENHVEYLLGQANIPYEMRQTVDGTRPDIIIPSKEAYEDPQFPDKKLFMIGVKTTCKDRWRQVTKEAPRIRRKHILTMQKGISIAQLDEIRQAGVTLVVPEALHKEFPPARRDQILTVSFFIDSLRAAVT